MPSRIDVDPYVAVWAARAVKAGMDVTAVVEQALADAEAEVFWTHPDIQAAEGVCDVRG